MTPGSNAGQGSWKPFVAAAVAVAPLFAVVWLAMTLTAGCATFQLALLKIIFTIVVVLTSVAGIRWATVAGLGLLVEALAALAWVLFKVEQYPPFGALRTILMLVTPIVASGVTLVLAEGFRAGTWPPHRFHDRRTQPD